MLLDSEIKRIKKELGLNVLEVGAEPLIGVHAVFSQVIQQYMSSGASTTSSTTVTAATAPTAVALTLDDATGFEVWGSVVVDVDDAQEIATVRSVAGNVVTLLLSKAHAGSYPVLLEGGEAMVRELLRKLRDLDKPGGVIEALASKAGIKKVDEVEFFGSDRGGSAAMGNVLSLQTHYRAELAKLCGVHSWWLEMNSAGGGICAVY